MPPMPMSPSTVAEYELSELDNKKFRKAVTLELSQLAATTIGRSKMAMLTKSMSWVASKFEDWQMPSPHQGHASTSQSLSFYLAAAALPQPSLSQQGLSLASAGQMWILPTFLGPDGMQCVILSDATAAEGSCIVILNAQSHALSLLHMLTHSLVGSSDIGTSSPVYGQVGGYSTIITDWVSSQQVVTSDKGNGKAKARACQ